MFRRRCIFYLYALVVALSTFSGVLRIGTAVYVILVFLFFLYAFVARGKKLRIGSSAIVFFLIICILSILVNAPPSYFRVWERLAIFLSTLLAFSPLLVSESLNWNRRLLFEGLLKVMLLFSVASFVGFFFGINFFVRNGDILAYNEAGHFSGFTNHSMALAPVSAIGGIYAMTKALLTVKKERQWYLWWSLTFACFGSVLLSASRGSLGGTLLAIVIVIYRYNAGRISRFFRYFMIGIAIVAFTFPLWGGLTQYVVHKNNYNISQGGIAYSREAKMEARVYEIRNNFFTGVGFSVVDETVDVVDHSTGTIEPNSSWLAVFSMTGVFGFLLFLGIFIHAFKTAYKRIPDRNAAVLLCGILGYFLIHMMIEGYIFAAGSFLCGTFWLTIGTTYAYSNVQQYKYKQIPKNPK